MKKYHRFTTPEEVKEWVAKHYAPEELKELNMLDNMESALAFYKGSGSSYMNGKVRLGDVHFKDKVDIDSLQQLLSSKKIKESIEVQRFVGFNEMIILLKGTSRNKSYEYPAFLSTTLLYKYYTMDRIKKGRVPIRIRIPQGTSGAYLPEVNSDQPEYEVLMPYHLKLKRINWWTFEVIT